MLLATLNLISICLFTQQTPEQVRIAMNKRLRHEVQLRYPGCPISLAPFHRHGRVSPIVPGFAELVHSPSSAFTLRAITEMTL